ncbi:MAG: hypothetical protein Q6M04_01540 [Thermostichus sp. BF3_bins_97]
MSPVLLQAVGYACGISIGILVLAALINFFLRRLDEQPTAKPAEAPAGPEGTPEGSQSA